MVCAGDSDGENLGQKEPNARALRQPAFRAQLDKMNAFKDFDSDDLFLSDH